jgi:transposase
MLVVETIGRIRREHMVKGKSIREIARDLKISRNTVRRVLRSGETSFSYEREVQPRPKIGRWKAELDGLLAKNAGTAARERLTLIRLFEELRALGYDGGYDAVRRYARTWGRQHAGQTAEVFVPLSFAPGEAYQFDWSHEVVLMNGATVTLKLAHVRLCHSRMMFVRAYPRETQEMVFDAHERAFAFFKGACTRGIYDNMKTAVEAVFIGKDRQYNRRFLQMCAHHLVDPVACTPASGWEKGQVENQVGLVRERFFTPRLRVKSYDELNAWLLDKCIAYAKAHAHPERPDQTVWEVFEEERPKLVGYRGRFDGFHALAASVSKTCLVRFDNNKYSVKPWGVRSRSTPTPTGSSSARTDAWSVNIAAASAGARRSMIHGITCQCWPASLAHCVTARRSGTGSCLLHWTACAGVSPAPMTAIGRWLPSLLRC